MAGGARPRGRHPPHGEPVLDRAFRLLGSFGPAHRSLTLASLSARSGLPKPTALRLARKLVEWGPLAVASRRHPEPMTSVACPVTDQRHGTVAALSVVTRPGRLEPATVRPALVAVARAISRAVAAAPGAPDLP